MEDVLRLAALPSWCHSRTRWERTAIIAWAVILLFVCVRVYLTPTKKTVYPIFSASARFWWSGVDLYEPDRPVETAGIYRYSPAFAVLVSPFALMPDALGGIAWRLVNAAAMLLALRWFARSVLPRELSADEFAWLALLVIPLTVASVNNGQSNLLVCAGMLGTVAAVREERWNLAAALMALTFAFKVYPITLGMVLITLCPRPLFWRITVAVGISLLAPFLFQHPAYVIDQHLKWFVCLATEDRSDLGPEHMYRDLWLTLWHLGAPIGRGAYFALQAAVGLAVAALCWRRQRSGWPQRELLTSTLGLVLAWIMLLGPATESSTFALLAPSLAWSVLGALRANRAHRRDGLLWMSAAIFALSVLGGAFQTTVKIHAWGIHAWGTIPYFAYLLLEPGRAVESARRTNAPPCAAAA